ncbi:MAG: hypothetical protein V4695_04165 [Pseudomonadota bacterium]
MNNATSRNVWHSGNRGARPEPVGLMRRDFATAALVEEGIALQEQAGTKFAAVFLDYKGIPVEIALRVLLRPGERRKTLVLAVPANVLSS